LGKRWLKLHESPGRSPNRCRAGREVVQSSKVMKRTSLILIVAAAFIVVSGLFGQSIVMTAGRRWSKHQDYDPKMRPPLSLTEAYALALGNLANETNRFHCVTASCVESTNKGFTGWMFRFADTNDQRIGVMVFFDGLVHRGETKAFTK
jgi:hypothetical protein